jgi:hypothetical protein
MISKVGVPSTFIEIGLNHVANTMSLYQTFGDPTLEMWTENPHRLVMPAVIDYDLTGTVSIELRYGVAGAKVTAFQKVDGKLMPLGRVMTDSRGQATMDTFGFDPALPIVFAACREDAVCIAPTGRRGASGSPEAPEAAVAVAAMASDRTPPPNTPLAARRAPMDPMVVDSVLSRSDSVGSQAASSLRVLRASRRAVRAEL